MTKPIPKEMIKAMWFQMKKKHAFKNIFITHNAFGVFSLASHQNTHSNEGKPKVMYNTLATAEKAAEGRTKIIRLYEKRTAGSGCSFLYSLFYNLQLFLSTLCYHYGYWNGFASSPTFFLTFVKVRLEMRWAVSAPALYVSSR